MGGSANSGTIGLVTGTASLNLASTGTVNSVSNGLGTTSLSSQTVTANGVAYGGNGIWTNSTGASWGTSGTMNGSWTTDGNALNTSTYANAALPGVDGSLSAGDTATFGSAIGATPASVTLDGASPSLSAITFNNSSAAYTLAQGSGGTLSLQSNANITDSNGSHTISAPVAFGASNSVGVAVTNSSDTLTMSGAITGSSSSLTKTGAGTLVVTNPGYTGATNINAGTLNAPNGLTGTVGTINIGDTAVLQAAGTVSRPIVASGTNQQATIQAIGALTISNSSAAASFPGLLDARGNLVQIVSPVQSVIGEINLTNGANISAGNGIAMNSYNGGDGTPGLTQGALLVAGSVTIGGTFQAGFTDGDQVLAVGFGSGATIDYTGTLKGSVSYFNVSVNFNGGGVDHEGFSPTFIPTVAGSHSFAASSLVAFNNTTPYIPVSGGSTDPSVSAGNVGGYTQYFIAGTLLNGSTTAGAGSFTAGNTFAFDTAAGSSNLNVSAGNVFATEKFYVVNTNGHFVANDVVTSGLSPHGTYQYLDGSLTGFSNITASSFTSLPTLPAGFQWNVESTSAYIKLYVGSINGVAQGNGVWLNGASDQKWTTNTSSTNNWSLGQPSSTGEIATFNASVTNYAGGVVNVDQAQTIGGISLTNALGGGYTIGVNGGAAITLDNATIDVSGNATHTDPTITASGTHIIAAPVVIASGSISGGSVNGLRATVAAASKLTISGGISSGFNTGNSVTADGAGVLVISGTGNTYSGATTVANGALEVAGTLAGTSQVNVNAGGTLTGAGIIGTAAVNGVLDLNGGILSPGATGATVASAGVNSIGTLTAANGFSILGNSTIKLDLQTPNRAGVGQRESGANDKLLVTGAISLTGTTAIVLNLMGYSPVAGDIFFIAENESSLNGSASNFSVANAGGAAWQVSTTANAATGALTGGNDIAVLVVPEPNSLSLLLGSLGLGLGLKRFRRRGSPPITA